MSQSKVTLKDVANAAGVSINTASRALNDKPDVRAATRRRIKAVAERLRYVPNPMARGLRGKSSRSLGVVVADIANPFFAEVIEGIEQAAFSSGFAITVGNTSEDATKEARLFRALVDQHVAGVLITPTQRSHDFIQQLQARDIPFVLIARRFEQVNTHAVLNDDYTGAYRAVDYLISAGYRRILFLNGPGHIWSARQRLQGYRKAIEDHGMPVLEDLIHCCQLTMPHALKMMEEILDAGPAIDAVFAFNDYLAIGAMKALRNQGVRVPEDVAVMGYDGIDIGEMIEPSLSTVSIARRRLGIEATNILIDQILGVGDHAGEPRQITLAPQLIVRESTPTRPAPRTGWR